ncbi:hypothetical protein PspLS_06362 [Pyricularia sp. CBS 133598]|nr:hypothetical protein PspLS_06362 [Pyricularia sp. CBS 133598]
MIARPGRRSPGNIKGQTEDHERESLVMYDYRDRKTLDISHHKIRYKLTMRPQSPGKLEKSVSQIKFLMRLCKIKRIVQIWHKLVYPSAEDFTLRDSFIPERWLGEDPRLVNDKKDTFQPFSVGRRNYKEDEYAANTS